MEIINRMPYTNPQLIGMIIACGIILNICRLVIYRLVLHPLRHIPGPSLARLTYGYQMYYIYLGGLMPRHLVKLHQKYGPIVRFAPDRVHVNDPEFYKRLFGPRQEFIKAKYFYDNIGIAESIITIRDIKAHRAVRNSLNPFFTPKAALNQSPLILDELKKLLINLGQENEICLINLQRTLGQFFVNISYRSVFGSDEMSQKDSLAIFDSALRWFSFFNLIITFQLVPKIALRLPDWLTARIDQGYSAIRQNVSEKCKARAKDSGTLNQHENVLDMLQASGVNVVHEVMEILIGGLLPSTATACNAIYFILSHPQALATLKKELAGLQKTSDGIPKCELVTHAPYLTAIVKETLRLRPSVGSGILPRVVPSKGIFIDDTFIPGGTIISTSIFSVNTNPTLFRDPLTFNPDRWLGPQSKDLENWFISFSKGPMMCLGKHFAMLSVSSVLAAVFSNFELTLYATDEEKMDWRDQGILMPTSHLMAFIKPINVQSSGTNASGVVDPDTIILPDFFVSWASTPIRLNPNYAVVAHEAEIWFKELCKHDEETHKQQVKADFGYFSGTFAPDAEAAEYRTTVDYCNWVWAFDDPFDEGSMKGRPDLIKSEVEKVLSIMSDNPPTFKPEEHPVMYTFQLIWQRIQKRSTKGVQRRFRQYQTDYLHQVLEQSNPKIIETYTDLEIFVANHRESVGAKPLVTLTEYCYGLDVPDFVFEVPAIQRIIDLTAELILLTNDVYSYAREAKAKHFHNVVHILRKGGMTQQEAFDHVGEAVLARYHEWDSVVKRIPSWGEEIDVIVERYIEISKTSVLSNLHWSFKSQRYFGSQHEIVRKTGRVPAVALA